ncbi:MAG: cell division protein ZipA, partial [Arenimonas sp.]
ISGAELILATEKVGLVYGHNNIYHRLAEGANANEPIFSMANVIQPGYFDLDQIDALQTPGVSFFMTLPGPVTAIQAWDSMLPIAERMAQLLDAVLLDSDRNALGRQRILHIKEELRAFDRDKERQTIKPGR